MLTGFGNLQNTVQSGFAGVDNAICNLGYNMQQGFNATQVANMQGNFALQQEINADTVANMQNTNALATQLANCYCENRAGQKDIQYQMATDTCAVQNTIQNTTRDIIDNQNANSKQILDFLVNDKIATLQAENQSLKLAASQADQNNFIAANQQAQTAKLIRRLGADCPVNAYVVATQIRNGSNEDVTANYEITYETGTLIINKAPGTLTVPETQINRKFGDAAFSLNCSTNGDGKISYASSNEDAASVLPDGTVLISGVGTAVITVSLAEGMNYTKAGDREVEITVAKADAPAAGQETRNYTYASVPEDDAEHAGSSEAVPFIIRKAVITVQAENKTAQAGSSLPELTYTVSGLAENEQLAAAPELSCNADMNTAGVYPITAGGAKAPDTDNYQEEIIYENGTLTVLDSVVHVTGVSLDKSTLSLSAGSNGGSRQSFHRKMPQTKTCRGLPAILPWHPWTAAGILPLSVVVKNNSKTQNPKDGKKTERRKEILCTHPHLQGRKSGWEKHKGIFRME